MDEGARESSRRRWLRQEHTPPRQVAAVEEGQQATLRKARGSGASLWKCCWHGHLAARRWAAVGAALASLRTLPAMYRLAEAGEAEEEPRGAAAEARLEAPRRREGRGRGYVARIDMARPPPPLMLACQPMEADNLQRLRVSRRRCCSPPPGPRLLPSPHCQQPRAQPLRAPGTSPCREAATALGGRAKNCTSMSCRCTSDACVASGGPRGASRRRRGRAAGGQEREAEKLWITLQSLVGSFTVSLVVVRSAAWCARSTGCVCGMSRGLPRAPWPSPHTLSRPATHPLSP